MLAKIGRNKPAILALLSLCVLALILLATTLLNTDWSTVRITDPIAYTLNQGVETGDTSSGTLDFNLPPLIIYAAIAIILIIIIVLEPRSFFTMVIASLMIFGFFTLVEDSIPRVDLTNVDTGFLAFGVTPEEDLDIVAPTVVESAPAWLSSAVALGVGLFVSGIAFVLFNLFAPERSDSAEIVEPIEKFKIDAHETLARIEAGYDLRSAILNCYAQMSNTLFEQRSIQRKAAITPREFEAELVRIGLPAQPVQRLTRLFESVRYSTEEPGVREQREAIDCLNTIIASVTSYAPHDTAQLETANAL